MSWSEWLARDTLVVYLFHGVVEESPWRVRNYTRKHLEARRFRSFLEDVLSAGGKPVSMEEVARLRSAGEPYPAKVFAVTFDDGFENNLSVAAPILREFGVPSTFYVSTGLVERNLMSWIDRIEAVIEAVLEGKGEGSLDLPWGEGRVAFRGREETLRLLDLLRKRVKADASLDADAFADGVARQLGREPVREGRSPLDLKLSWGQVRELASDPLFLVGGHSHKHSILSFLPPGELEDEIDLSLRLLKEKAGVGADHYSYPEGLEHCFNDRVIAALKERGVRCCPTAITGVNPAAEAGGFDLFHLRRVPVL